jgi:hypothetical protein
MTLSKEVGVGLYSRESLRSKIRIVRERERDLLEAYVPLGLIHSEDVPVDRDHVLNLAASIKKEEEGGKKNGQLSPLLLGEIEGLGFFRILDGFHRCDALKELGKEEAFATVKLNCTEQDALDLRIVSAVSHKSVNFSRTVDWSRQAWDLSLYSKKLRLTEAFDLRFSEKRAKSGITKEEVSEIRKWIDDKCKRWDIHAPTLHKYLMIAEIADPQLVKSVRFQVGGSGGLKALTVNHLKEISMALPGNYEFQQIVSGVVLRDELRVPGARELAKAVSKAKTKEEALRIANSGSWKETGGSRMQTSSVEKRKKESGEIIKLRDELFLAEERIAELLMVNAGIRREKVETRKTEEAMRIIRRVSLNLPFQQRTLFILLKDYDLSMENIAKILQRKERDIIEDVYGLWEAVKKSSPMDAPNLKMTEAIKQPKLILKNQPSSGANIEKVIPNGAGAILVERTQVHLEGTKLKKVEIEPQRHEGNIVLSVNPPNVESKTVFMSPLTGDEIYVVAKRLLRASMVNKELLVSYNINVEPLYEEPVSRLISRLDGDLSHKKIGKDTQDFEREHLGPAIEKIKDCAKNPAKHSGSSLEARILLSCFDFTRLRSDLWEKL